MGLRHCLLPVGIAGSCAASLLACSDDSTNFYVPRNDGGFGATAPDDAGAGGGDASTGNGGSGGRAGSGGGTGTAGDAGSGASNAGGGDAGGLPDGSTAAGLGGFGDACAAGSDPCRTGLVCTSGQCAFGHQGAVGTPCVAAGECQSGMACALGVCAPAGTGAEGTACTVDVDCAGGLRCGIVGFGAECVPEGDADVGQSCIVSGDCFAGLLCATPPGGATACAPIPTTGPTAGLPFGIPTAPTLACDAPATGRVDAIFEVPGAQGSAANGDFFRLPFPNDSRIGSGVIDLTGFPTPGASLLGFDPVKGYVDAITASETGWGTSPTVLFRFSGGIDFDSLVPVTGQPSPVQFLDVTDPQNPANNGAKWSYSGSGGKYICHDWLAVRRPDDAPLEPGHRYIVYLSTVALDRNGLAVQRSPQLAALLGASAPADAALSNAYAAYAPLRDYLAAKSVDPATILNATVITVGPTRTLMADLATAVQAAPVPTAAGWVKCDGVAVSPCPQAAAERACGTPDADFDEYHALVSLPVFQKGTAPYADAGGDVDTTAPVRNEDVCASLTVPKGTMPAAGWSLAVFGHGTGGSFRSHVRPEVAGALAKAATPVAVLGFDEVQHGPRRGASTASPNVLFFNFKNPAAARGNPLQGAADVISMGRFAKVLAVPASVTGGSDVTADPAALVYFGHSQGAMHGSLGLPYTNDYVAAVLSGNGASLAHALLTKTSPSNVAAAVPLLLGGDFDSSLALFGGENHPVLTLLQQWIDPADPLNFARAMARQRNTGILPKSVLLPYGLGDTYSPPLTMRLYDTAGNFPLAAHDPSVTTPDDIGEYPEQPVPLAGNFAAAGRTVTIGIREYQNAAGKDGHFVVFDVASANQDAVRFLSTAAAGSVPPIGQ